jgi:hypothetical protein
VNEHAETCAVAFKEWQGVCDALMQGRQTIIVRKGGINEAAGAGAFAPEHSEFWLYPTTLHQAGQGLRLGARASSGSDFELSSGLVPIRALVRVDLIGHVGSERVLPALEEFHVYTAETILKRFQYRRPGFWVLCARVWKCETPFLVRATAEHAGCKTWVAFDLPLPTSPLAPVLDNDQWAAVRERLHSIL